MPRGPAWTSHEDNVLKAARQIGIEYHRVVIVMPHRTSTACRMRNQEIRRMSGKPARPAMTPERKYTRAYFESMCEAGSKKLLEALRQHHPEKVQHVR